MDGIFDLILRNSDFFDFDPCLGAGEEDEEDTCSGWFDNASQEIDDKFVCKNIVDRNRKGIIILATVGLFDVEF